MLRLWISSRDVLSSLTITEQRYPVPGVWSPQERPNPQGNRPLSRISDRPTSLECQEESGLSLCSWERSSRRFSCPRAGCTNKLSFSFPTWHSYPSAEFAPHLAPLLGICWSVLEHLLGAKSTTIVITFHPHTVLIIMPRIELEGRRLQATGFTQSPRESGRSQDSDLVPPQSTALARPEGCGDSAPETGQRVQGSPRRLGFLIPPSGTALVLTLGFLCPSQCPSCGH